LILLFPAPVPSPCNQLTPQRQLLTLFLHVFAFPPRPMIVVRLLPLFSPPYGSPPQPIPQKHLLEFAARLAPPPFNPCFQTSGPSSPRFALCCGVTVPLGLQPTLTLLALRLGRALSFRGPSPPLPYPLAAPPYLAYLPRLPTPSLSHPHQKIPPSPPPLFSVLPTWPGLGRRVVLLYGLRIFQGPPTSLFSSPPFLDKFRSGPSMPSWVQGHRTPPPFCPPRAWLP